MPSTDLNRRGLLASLAATAVAATVAPALALDPVFSRRRTALGGYDPVAYFTEGKPIEGSDSFSHQWQGTTWHFASAENRDSFAADPERYAPQYGGYCAWAVSQGYTASTNPEAWRIVGDKLYLNYSKSVQRRWEKDVPGNIAKANRNWPGLLDGG